MVRKSFLLLTAITALSALLFGNAIDAGAEWSMVQIQDDGFPELNGLYFADARNGWVVGQLVLDQKGMIAHTKNGGVTWELQEQPSDKTFSSIFFISPKVGWAVGQDGTIVTTKDGGKNWKFQTSKVPNWLYDVFFIDKNTGWIVGMAETILKTTNGGKTWKILRGGKPPSGVGEGALILRGVHFVNENTGWVVGQSGLILHTKDGGVNWEKQESSTEENLNDVFFTDENTGWAVGAFGVLLHTNDAGATWKIQKSNTEEEFFGVYFVKKSQEGWAVGSYGTILHTKDGQSWEKQQPPVSAVTKKPISGDLRSVFAIDPQHSWIAASPDLVLKYTK